MEAVDRAETPEAKAAAEKAYQKQAELLNKRGQAYKDFCKDNNLKQRNERITIAKWDREQAKAARVAAKKKERNNEKSTTFLVGSHKIPFITASLIFPGGFSSSDSIFSHYVYIAVLIINASYSLSLL